MAAMSKLEANVAAYFKGKSADSTIGAKTLAALIERDGKVLRAESRKRFTRKSEAHGSTWSYTQEQARELARWSEKAKRVTSES